jgi:hypothetical protein
MLRARDAAARDAIGAWVEGAIAAASNNERLKRRLDTIDSEPRLLRFLHRFALFNDSLAARVPFLVGLIHLTPNLFLSPDGDEDFCRQSNGRIAAFVAKAANDEYGMPGGQNLVHQYLSQQFFRGVLAHYVVDRRDFNRLMPVPPQLGRLLDEARSKFFSERTPEQIFSALGFHVGLEFFAHEEFNLVDGHLRSRHPALVASLERADGEGPAYRWLKIHTVVEIEHYRAGLEALRMALGHYRDPSEAPAMRARIEQGFAAFVDLQHRFYEAILCDLN